jgi:4-hydroxybenzoate polyprenyltransferase
VQTVCSTAGLSSAMAFLQVVSGMALGAGPLYYAGVAGSAAHLFWQVNTVQLEEPADCLEKFKSNAHLGVPLFLGTVADRLFAVAPSM